MHPPIAELESVTKLYGPHQALGPLTLEIPGGTVGLLGPNGAGKSTLIRILLGLMPPTSGEVRVLGQQMTGQSTGLRRRIGYAPEGDTLFPDMTGVEAVSFAGRLVGMRRSDALQRAHQVLDYVELGEERYRLVENYSTGMRQRLKLAQSIVHDPELLILDEPTEGVDPEARSHLLELLAELQRDHGLQMLISTHLLPDVEEIASHAIVLNKGQVAASGTLDELRDARSSAYLVRVNGPADALTERLTEAGVTWEPMTPNIRVDTDDPRVVLQHASDAGLVVRHLAPLTLTLEDAVERAVARPAPAASAGGGGDA